MSRGFYLVGGGCGVGRVFGRGLSTRFYGKKFSARFGTGVYKQGLINASCEICNAAKAPTVLSTQMQFLCERGVGLTVKSGR